MKDKTLYEEVKEDFMQALPDEIKEKKWKIGLSLFVTVFIFIFFIVTFVMEFQHEITYGHRKSLANKDIPEATYEYYKGDSSDLIDKKDRFGQFDDKL